MTGLQTVTQIAIHLDETRRRVDYIISRSRIEPTCRVGIIKLFDVEKVARIKHLLFNMQIQKTYK